MPDVIFNGPDGRLEGRYRPSNVETDNIALLLHPHPEHGGTMNNKIVYVMHQVFSQLGFATLRFNFRGVGKSQGTFDRGEGELADAAAALDWLQTNNPHARNCWVAGFSFGAWIGMQLLMRRPEITSYISAAPPANMFDFNFLAPCPTSGLIIQGGNDDLVPVQSVNKLVSKLRAQKDIEVTYRLIESANHFFSRELDQFTQYLYDYVANSLGNTQQKP